MEQQMSAFVAGACLIMSLPGALCVSVRICVRVGMHASVPVCVCGSEYMFETLEVSLSYALQADSSHMIICQDIVVLCVFFVWVIWKYFFSEVSYF